MQSQLNVVKVTVCLWEKLTQGVCNCSMFCCALLYVHSSFTIIWIGKRAGCFAYFVYLVSRDCCVALPRGAMGLSAVCDCGIS